MEALRKSLEQKKPVQRAEAATAEAEEAAKRAGGGEEARGSEARQQILRVKRAVRVFLVFEEGEHIPPRG